MDLHKIQYIKLMTAAGILSALLPSAPVRAEFVLDWAPDTASPTFSGTSVDQGATSIPGQTPFVYERVSDPVSGQAYYHMIVGSPDEGFAQEVYIQVGGPCSGCQGFNGIGTAGSPSLGATTPTGNGTDPLGTNATFTGNASGNPQRVEMHEVLTDGDFSSDFTKALYLDKPTITQGITDSDFQTKFVIDESGISYSDNTTPAVITNTMQIIDPNIPEGSASFDMATDSQDSTVTAGRYTYTPGPGTGAAGTYTYLNDTFNPGNINWSDYFDSSLSNPWTYPTNRP